MATQESRETPSYRLAVVGQAVGGVLMLLAAVALPWVSYQQRGTVSEHSLGAGALAPALAIVGLLGVAAAAIQVARRSGLAPAVAAAIGTCGLVLSGVAAAGRMASANDQTLVTGGATSWAMGPVIGVLASLAMAVGAIVVMARR